MVIGKLEDDLSENEAKTAAKVAEIKSAARQRQRQMRSGEG
jgi:hypothetical protein